MAEVLGLDAKLYYLTTGTREAWPVSGPPDNLTEIDNVKDLTLSLESEEADTTTRAASGWKTTATTLLDASLEFEMQWDTSDAAFTALQTAFFAKTSIALAVLDASKDEAGSQGLWADWKVSNFSRAEPLTDTLKVSVTLKPARSDVAPEWVTTAT